MFNKDLYLLAYGNIYSNSGAMTPGASAETADGMSEEKIEQITGLMRREKYRFSPARRVYIPKTNGKLRPLGILAEEIHDQRFLRLIRNMLKAGYLEDWEYHETLSGCPQGGVVSPILSNIYLHKLDEFVERELIPQYTRGAGRKTNPEYKRIYRQLENARRRGDRAAARDLRKRLRTLPTADPMDPGYRRLRYIRYADDHILGFTGPKAEAEQIKARLAAFLRETLGLELSQQKTLITHARSQPARFLGYHIKVQHCDAKIIKGQRGINGKIALRVPPDVIRAQCARYREHGKPWHRSGLQNLDDYDIVRIYGAEYRGVVNYY